MSLCHGLPARACPEPAEGLVVALPVAALPREFVPRASSPCPSTAKMAVALLAAPDSSRYTAAFPVLGCAGWRQGSMKQLPP